MAPPKIRFPSDFAGSRTACPTNCPSMAFIPGMIAVGALAANEMAMASSACLRATLRTATSSETPNLIASEYSFDFRISSGLSRRSKYTSCQVSADCMAEPVNPAPVTAAFAPIPAAAKPRPAIPPTRSCGALWRAVAAACWGFPMVDSKIFPPMVFCSAVLSAAIFSASCCRAVFFPW